MERMYLTWINIHHAQTSDRDQTSHYENTKKQRAWQQRTNEFGRKACKEACKC